MNRSLLAALACVLVLLVSGPARAADQPKEGQAFPALELAKPTQAAALKYLGLPPGAGVFSLGQVKAQVVLVEVFSMYCPICQAEAPRINQLNELIKARSLADRLKVVGLGAGNSDFEVGVFRDKYQVPFPLLPDPDFKAHKALGEPRTPWFLLLRTRPGAQPQIIFTHLGGIGEPPAFLDTLVQKAGLK